MIPNFRRVLIPTDFSECATRAVAFGYGLTEVGGVVHLLHVVTGSAGGDHTDPRQRLWALVPRAAQGKKVRTEVELCEDGEPAASIARAAARLQVDAICMGRQGTSGASRKRVLGSQTTLVLERVRKPVLLVGPEDND
jgi:nucleotide-binding universal stress UspA family protein